MSPRIHNASLHLFVKLGRQLGYHSSVVNARRLSTSRGFTALELLIVVAIIGIVSAIALPVVVVAIQRAHQSQTMADMRTIAGALVLYEQDFVDYPLETSLAGAENLRPHLKPYTGEFKATDGWNREYLYVSDGHRYTLISYALGGKPDTPYVNGPTHRFEEDIVMSEGIFVQWPAGVQH